MNYLDTDIYYFFSLKNHIHYNNKEEKGILKYIDALYLTLVENKDLLSELNVQYEHLEDIYILNKQINTMSFDLLEDSLQFPKLTLLASLLVLLKGDVQYSPKFEQLISKYPDYFMFKLVFQTLFHKKHIYADKIDYIRQAFQNMNKTIIPLRKNLIEEEVLLIQEQNKIFKNFYQHHTLEESLDFVKTLPFYDYVIDYKTWYLKNYIK